MPPNYRRTKSDTPDQKRGNPRLAGVADDANGLPSLTPKQEAFAQAVLAGKANVEAYSLAYPNTKMKPSSKNVEACKMKVHAKISQYIRFYQRQGAVETKTNLENHLAELARGREIAYDLGQASAGIQAEHYRGRVAGLYNDKLTIGIGPSDEALVGQIAALLGVEAAEAIGQGLGLSPASTVALEASEEAQVLALPSPLED